MSKSKDSIAHSKEVHMRANRARRAEMARLKDPRSIDLLSSPVDEESVEGLVHGVWNHDKGAYDPPPKEVED